MKIAGTAEQGQKLTASNTLADADGLGAITYQWLRGGAAIAGATGATCTAAVADVGQFLAVKSSYVDRYGTAESATSAVTAAVALARDQASGTAACSSRPMHAVPFSLCPPSGMTGRCRPSSRDRLNAGSVRFGRHCSAASTDRAADRYPVMYSNAVPISIDMRADGSGTARCGGDCTAADKLGFDFGFAYQPIVDLAVGEVWAHEALVRGPQGEGALSVLQRVNHDNRYRFDQLCRVRAIREAVALGIDTRLSINFLPNAVYKPEVCIRTTLEAARTHGLPIDRIIFETTEGEHVQDSAWYAEVMREYKRIGFLTAIDDFGAGYAGLSLLADFVPDIVKLDMALLRGIDACGTRQAIVRHATALCCELGVRVIAEGVETAGERDFLADIGITLMQGYFFAKPAFRALVAARQVPMFDEPTPV